MEMLEKNSSGEQKKQNKAMTWLCKSPFIRNLVISCMVLLIAIVCCFIYVAASDTEHIEQDIFDIQPICELASLKCTYHNIAWKAEGKSFLGLLEKEVWLEYDGYITLGIDMDKVYISKPSKKGVVEIYLPPVKQLSSGYDESSIQKPVAKSGLFAEITGQYELELIDEAQEEMVNGSQYNERIYKEAYNHAKVLIEQYVINVGKATGKDYTVKWLESSPDENIGLDKTTEEVTE